MLIETYTFQPVKILQIVRESPRAVSIEVERPENYVFQSGQHAIVRVALPDGTRLVRQYSFSAAPNAENLWFTIVQQDTGEVSTWFNTTATTSDIIEISPPFMGPLVQKIPRGNICMIAGGSGIAPLMSHLRALRDADTPYTVTLLYSTRLDEQCFKNELVARGAHETIIPRLTDSASRFTGEEITRELTSNTHVYICGSRSFVLSMRHECEKIVQPDHIYSEAFTL